MVSLAIGRLLQRGVQELPCMGVKQLDEDTPMAGLWQAPAAQDFPCEFRQSGQQRRVRQEILTILGQYRRPVAFRTQQVRIMPLRCLIAAPCRAANIYEALRLLGPVPELRIMSTAHVQQGRIAQLFDPASAIQFTRGPGLWWRGPLGHVTPLP